MHCSSHERRHVEMSYISTFCFLAAAPPDDPDALVVALPPPVALPDLGGAAAGVRVLADPAALPDLPRGAGGGEALGGGGRASVEGCSGAVGRAMSSIANGLALALALGAGGGGGPGVYGTLAIARGARPGLWGP